MAISEAKKRADEKYRRKAYDQINIRLRKGTRDRFIAFAESRGESLAGMVQALVEAEIERSGWTPPTVPDDEEEEL